MERSELCRDHIGRRANVPVLILKGDRIFYGIIHARIVEGSLAMHLCVGDICVPVCDRAPASVGMEIHAGKAKGGWQERGSGFAVRTEGFAVLQYLGIVLARAPARKNLFHWINVSMQTLCNWLQIGGERCNGAHIEVSVRPAVAAMTD